MKKPHAKSDFHELLIPSAFRLAGTRWTVVRVPGLSELGKCDRDAATIFIRVGMAPQVAASTFFHELMHAVLFTTGLTEHSEKDVDLWGALLHQFMVSVEFAPELQ